MAKLPAMAMLVIYVSAFIRVPVSDPTWFLVLFRIAAVVASVVAIGGLSSKVSITPQGFTFSTWRRRFVAWEDVSELVGGRLWIWAIRTRDGRRFRLPGRVTIADLDRVAPVPLEVPRS
jgi:hypothetical protein